MHAEERYALGSKIMRDGIHHITYTINKVFYPDAHMFLGVAQITDDPAKAETWAFNPPTGNLYNGHELNEHGDEKRVHLMAGDPKATNLVGKMEQSMITMTVDMQARKLHFSVNGEDALTVALCCPRKACGHGSSSIMKEIRDGRGGVLKDVQIMHGCRTFAAVAALRNAVRPDASRPSLL